VREVQLGERWFRSTVDPISDEQGGCAGSVHILTDITQRKELEEQLRQGQKLEAIGRLAGGVAHDFNNLLTVILGNVSLLHSSLPREAAERDLTGTIERAAWRAAELTRQLLGFSRQTLLWLEVVNLNDPLTEVVRNIERTLPCGVSLEVRTTSDLWPVQADPGQITQVLLNLCVNAFDALPAGGRLVLESANRVVDEGHALAHADARAGAFACLSVTDTGTGIPEDVLPRIFEPFFTTKPPGQGTGLGLAMVHGIVKQHQGWVECRSKLGAGTAFDVYFPRSTGRPGDRARPATSATPGGTETILVADDNDLLRPLAGALLRQNGFHVLLAEDGAGAVELYRAQPERVHLVLLALSLPGPSAEDVLARLREASPGVRALIVGAEESGAPVTTPYHERQLVQAVRDALDVQA
jgi:signal transduction histidine kinase/CheY-like chemotaxis protein